MGWSIPGNALSTFGRLWYYRAEMADPRGAVAVWDAWMFPGGNGYSHLKSGFQLSSRKAYASSRAFQPAAFASWQDGGLNGRPGAMAAIIAAGGVFLGVGNVSCCEMNKKTSNVEDPGIFSSPDEDTSDQSSPDEVNGVPKDPVTPYAKFAAKREMEKEQEEKANATTTQATSPGGNLGELLPNQYISDMTVEELRIEEATRKAKQHSGGIKLFSGNGNMALSLEIARHLGINLGKATVGRFADGEANVVIHENVRGKDCYVIQPTCPPVNDNIMELLLMVSTLRRASARRITVVIPYYGYARQDRKMQVRINGKSITVYLVSFLTVIFTKRLVSQSLRLM